MRTKLTIMIMMVSLLSWSQTKLPTKKDPSEAYVGWIEALVYPDKGLEKWTQFSSLEEGKKIRIEGIEKNEKGVRVARVHINGKIGYVKLSDIHLIEETDKKEQVIEITASQNYFILPYPDFYYRSTKNVGTIKPGEKIKVVKLIKKRKDHFAMIDHKGKAHYILYSNDSKDFVKLEEDITVKKCHYLRNETDEFTGERKKHTIRYSLKDKNTLGLGFSIELRNTSGQKHLWIHSFLDLGCAVSYKSNRSSVKFKLKNGNIVSFYHFGDTDCGSFSIIANLTNSDVVKLKESPIQSVRFSGTKFYHDEKNIKWDTFFIDKLKCIN